MTNFVRNNKWLENLLADIWLKYFPDVVRQNDVKIKFGRPAKTRLGSIKWGRKLVKHPNGELKKRSIITITGYFKHEDIPEDVVRGVIAHELVHYAHGFSSPLPQLHQHPHKGGIVDKEMVKRGLTKELELEKNWLRKNWITFLKKWHSENPTPKRRRIIIKRKVKKSIWDILFS